jgi:hypothetical protein
MARKNLELMELLDNEELAQQARKAGKKAVTVRLELVPRTTYVPSLTVVKMAR